MTEREKWQWACENQGFKGSYDDWLALDADEREQYELGAQGIPTEE